MPESDLNPGFMVIHGNHPEDLRDLLVSWIRRHPLAPLEDEVVLVQSNGIAQWLKLAMAADVHDGGCGVAAALDAQLPSRFIWQAYRSVLGEAEVPRVSPFDKALLVWRLMRLLPPLLTQPAFAPLQRFLASDTDLRRRHQLAERLADLFDQYQVYRADWLADWARSNDTVQTSRHGRQPLPATLAWQPVLWRALLDDAGERPGAAGRAEVHRRFMAAAATRAADDRPAGLPRRLLVFGISSLPQQSLEVLAALARWTQVLMCVHNPCEHHWADIVGDKDLLRAEAVRQRRRPGTPAPADPHGLHLHAHPLLAAWGKQGRDFIALLDLHDQREQYEHRLATISRRIDLFEPTDGSTLLRQLQDDIRDLRPLAETRARWPAVDPAHDRSIRFHVTHGPQREVEVLHDELLAAFEADSTLRARDVIVMVPDIDAYAAHVQAVFGLHEPGDPRHLPYALSDQGQRHRDRLLGAVETLLQLPQSRLPVSELLDLLEVPAVQRRFGIAASQLPLLHRWVQAANIRWGLHADARERLDLPDAPDQNSWRFGLRRMLLGYAVGDGAPWHDIEPLDEVGGLDAALLGPLARLLERLDQHWQALCEPAPPETWGERLRALLADFLDTDPAEGGLGATADDTAQEAYTLQRLDTALQAWQDACADAGFTEPVPLSVVREQWLQEMEAHGPGQSFIAGSITFATLMPMRAIPFRIVCLLGMNDGDYPRARVPMDFDLMAQDYRPGDRSRREDDRYLFLEALLSARDRLHISWVGRSIHDNTERPPSVLVAQLRDHLDAGWRPAHGSAQLAHALTIEHRLQPFHRDYFTDNPRGLFSHAREWHAGLAAVGQGETPAPAALPPWLPPPELGLRALSDFLKDPVAAFFQQRLGIRFELADPATEDHEPFGLDALLNWQLQDELIQAQLAALRDGQDRVAALEHTLARMQRRGALPVADFGALHRQHLAEPMDSLFRRLQAALARWPHPLDDAPVLASEPVPVADWLDALRTSDGGERARVVADSRSLVQDRRYQRDKLVGHWVRHLAGHLGGQPLTSVIVSKAGDVTLPPLPIDQARQLWRDLAHAWQDGMCRPLPLALRAGMLFIEKGGTSDTPLDHPAAQAARARYEDHDERHNRWAEAVTNPYLARAYPTFADLWAGGEFAHWCHTLLAPLAQAVGSKAPDDEGAA